LISSQRDLEPEEKQRIPLIAKARRADR
jgi:hypothetical protein